LIITLQEVLKGNKKAPVKEAKVYRGADLNCRPPQADMNPMLYFRNKKAS
jgi:hypothetical protein